MIRRSFLSVIATVLLLGSPITIAGPVDEPTSRFETTLRELLDTVINGKSQSSFTTVSRTLNKATHDELTSLTSETWAKLLESIKLTPEWVGMPTTPLNHIVRVSWPHLPTKQRSDLAYILFGFAVNFQRPELQLLGLRALNQIYDPGSCHGFWEVYQEVVRTIAPKLWDSLAFEAGTFIITHARDLEEIKRTNGRQSELMEIYISTPLRLVHQNKLDSQIAFAFRRMGQIILHEKERADELATQFLKEFIKRCKRPS